MKTMKTVMVLAVVLLIGAGPMMARGRGHGHGKKIAPPVMTPVTGIA